MLIYTSYHLPQTEHSTLLSCQQQSLASKPFHLIGKQLLALSNIFIALILSCICPTTFSFAFSIIIYKGLRYF
jgi:hypothetical protein